MFSLKVFPLHCCAFFPSKWPSHALCPCIFLWKNLEWYCKPLFGQPWWSWTFFCKGSPSVEETGRNCSNVRISQAWSFFFVNWIPSSQASRIHTQDPALTIKNQSHYCFLQLFVLWLLSTRMLLQQSKQNFCSLFLHRRLRFTCCLRRWWCGAKSRDPLDCRGGWWGPEPKSCEFISVAFKKMWGKNFQHLRFLFQFFLQHSSDYKSAESSFNSEAPDHNSCILLHMGFNDVGLRVCIPWSSRVWIVDSFLLPLTKTFVPVPDLSLWDGLIAPNFESGINRGSARFHQKL